MTDDAMENGAMEDESVGMAPDEAGPPSALPIGARALKRSLRARLEAAGQDVAAGRDAGARYEAIADQAATSHQVLGALIALTYDGDPRIAWRAVHALGRAAERVARDDPDLVRRYLRRLFWLITEESGGICWFAPQAMAEVARTHPAFADFVPITMNLLGEMAEEDLQHFRPGILWAIGRLGPLASPHMEDVLPAVEAALDHPDPGVRGLAAWALGRAGQGERVAGRAAAEGPGQAPGHVPGQPTRPVVDSAGGANAAGGADRPGLLDDPAPVTLFVDGEPVETTVGELAREALTGAG